jgi:hypothetical protein
LLLRYLWTSQMPSETNQLGKTRTRAYDAVGNQVEMIDSYACAKGDRNGRKTAYSYYTLNHQTTEKWLDGTSPLKPLALFTMPLVTC